MRYLALVLALWCAAALAYPLSCWTNRPETVVTITGYAGAAARISGSLPLWDGPLGERTLHLGAPKTDAAISEISIACKSPLVGVPGLTAVKEEESMFLSPSAKIPAGYQLPVVVWIDEPRPGIRRATIGGKPQ